MQACSSVVPLSDTPGCCCRILNIPETVSPDYQDVYAESMNNEELSRTLEYCHGALGDTLMLISDLLSQKGNPEEIIRRIEENQDKYNTVTRIMRDHGG